MIKINLIPPDLSKEGKKLSIPKIQVGDIAKYAGLAKKIAFGIISVHVILLFVFIVGKSYLAALNSRLNSIKPALERVNQVKNELKNLEAQAKFVNDLRARRPLWSRNLNKISEFLPKGMWFKHVAVSETNFNLEGSIVCTKCSHVDAIGGFLNGLKKEDRFMQGFIDLELASVQKKTVGGMDVADFLITGKLKETP